MRGKGLPGFDEIMNAGITPAYAGKRLANLGEQAVLKDHPRVCGEKTLAVQSSNSHQGSPPRMRGKETTG